MAASWRFAAPIPGGLLDGLARGTFLLIPPGPAGLFVDSLRAGLG